MRGGERRRKKRRKGTSASSRSFLLSGRSSPLLAVSLALTKREHRLRPSDHTSASRRASETQIFPEKCSKQVFENTRGTNTRVDLGPPFPFSLQFGPTAYTPGLRRVKVELRSEPQEEPAQDPILSARPSASGVARGNRTSSFSSSTSNHLDFLQHPEAVSPATSGSHPSPDDTHRTRGESPSRSRAEENKRALFKRGRDKAFPTNEIFEEL